MHRTSVGPDGRHVGQSGAGPCPYECRAPDRRRAFTLLEVLVVVGIIAALVGLLLPTLVGARRASNGVLCLSNLRQWGLAAQVYAIANNGYLPRRGQGVQPTSLINRPQDWFNALPTAVRTVPYTQLAAAGEISRPGGRGTIWLCPEAREFAGAYYWSYGMNMGLSVETASQNNGLPDKVTGVGNASTMVFMADAPGNYCSVIPSKIVDGYNPVARHRGAVNICFLDGHAVPVPGAYIGIGKGLIERPDARWHPPNNTWNSAP